MSSRFTLDLDDAPELSGRSDDAGWGYLRDGGRIRCVFSSDAIDAGSGALGRRTVARTHWLVEQIDDERCEARRINSHHVPTGDVEIVSMQRLVEKFVPQLGYYEDVVIPAMENLDEIIERGDEYREDGRLYSAEMEYDRALGIEERNVRGLFGLGLIYLSRREIQRTRELLGELVTIKAAFDGKNQHLFNEFGISLRKAGLFNEAVVYYKRALDFVKSDEHLYYNLARAHYEAGDWNGCLDALIRSNRINPGLGVARDLFKVIVGLAEDERLLHHYNKPPVPGEVVERAKRILAVETGQLALDDHPVVFGLERGRARSGGVSSVSRSLYDPDGGEE